MFNTVENIDVRQPRVPKKSGVEEQCRMEKASKWALKLSILNNLGRFLGQLRERTDKDEPNSLKKAAPPLP
jgi:hypothetical protein